jgi:hypothetical protein
MKNVHEVRKVRRMRTGEFVRNLCAPAPPLVSHFAVVRMCLCADGEVEPRAADGGVLSYNCTTDYYCLPGGAGVRLQGKEKEA